MRWHVARFCPVRHFFALWGTSPRCSAPSRTRPRSQRTSKTQPRSSTSSAWPSQHAHPTNTGGYGATASVPQGRADDHSNDGKSLVNYLLTAKREDAELAARQYETGLKTLHFGTFGPGAAAVPEAANRLGAPPSGPHSLKRKARDGHSTMQPFRSVPSSGPSRGDGSAPQRFTGPGATSGGGERRQEHFCTA
ncbi:hypothetical protein A4X03_0g6223 [Tilletia caries]|uniref:Uncharacterized protein n=1 Tax=Tilletia caries TaxID=13290 RepID=A0A177U622_9BASI|nr:hypothetical protein A4X03_0g6223 [Tilletia caries]